MKTYIISGNESKESHDTCRMIFNMYADFLRQNGFQFKEIVLEPSTHQGRGGVFISNDNQLAFETDFNLDECCGFYRICRISPHCNQGLRHTSFPLMRNAENPDYKYGILSDLIISIVLNPYEKLVSEKFSLDIHGEEIKNVLGGDLPWLKPKN